MKKGRHDGQFRVSNPSLHGAVSVPEGKAGVVTAGNGAGTELVSEQLPGRRAESKAVPSKRRMPNIDFVSSPTRVVGLGRNRPLEHRDSSGIGSTRQTTGQLLPLECHSNKIVEVLGDWVMVWAFLDVPSESKMREIINVRFRDEQIGVVPTARDVVYINEKKTWGCRSFWEQQSVSKIIRAAELTDHKKELVCLMPTEAYLRYATYFKLILDFFGDNVPATTAAFMQSQIGIMNFK